ncbi:MAG: metal ABC transporter substrate-binding protein [Candidatus Methylomirabilales bacterium]
MRTEELKRCRCGFRVVCAVVSFLLWAGHAQAGKIRVVTTTTDLKALVEAVGGEQVQAVSLTKGYQDLHNVAIKPSYIRKLFRADLFVRVGLDQDFWGDSLLDASRNSRIARGASGYVDASRGVPLLEVPSAPVTRAAGDIHIFGNPHYWLDPESARIITRNILAGLERVAPEQAGTFRQNRNRFLTDLNGAMTKWLKQIEPYRGTKVVTYHRTWSYFARRFGLEVIGNVEPKPGVPPSAAHLKKLMGKMKDEKVRLILMTPYFDLKTPKFIAQEVGAKVLVLPSSVQGVSGVRTYLDLFDHIIESIVQALQESPVIQ